VVRAFTVALVLASPLGIAAPQTTSSQLWGEVDGYWTPPRSLTPLRFLGTAAFTRSEEVDALEATLGLHAIVAHHWGSVRLGMNLTQSVSSEDYREAKIVAELNTPATTGQWRIRSRTRLEQRWILGAPSQRYRERLRLERQTVLWRRDSILAYAAYEVYYDTRYRALSRTGYRVGVELPLSSRLKLEPSAVRQDNRFGSPRHVSATAMTISLLY
jgi:hypothetical protein